MGYGEAFAKLGYKLDSHRQDWSAENATGVCISIWQCEMKLDHGQAWIDTTLHAQPLALWQHLPGNRKRIKHLRRAVENGGDIDVVVVRGTPGLGVKDAEPWLSAQRKGTRWHITDFDPSTGHFSAKATSVPTSI